ncbi:MAG: Na/Pi cotransporter family protein [Bacillota bacterium]|nr:Na/Pi cotransporter family protein [Bacillota bacterium]
MESILDLILPLAGGLGLFLYGMTIMSAGLEKTAGDRLEKIVEKLSGNVFRGVLVGTVVTTIVQSSSATTVMVVGFVNAGIMTLNQAIGIIMGANIGTTITAQMVSIDVHMLAPIAIAVGVAIRMFAKKNRNTIIGEIILGFGILFFGMEVMKDALAPIKQYEGFSVMISSIGTGSIGGVIKGFLIGLVVTAIVQSSSATTGIMIALASSGSLPISAAFPILLGTNVGTCVTAILSSIGASKTAKRAALMHLLFNLIGTIVFVVFFFQLTLGIIQQTSELPARQLANAHTLFNVVNTLLLLPFSALIVKASKLILPMNKEEEANEGLGQRFLDERILSTPQIAMGQVFKEVLHMADIAKTSLQHALHAMKEGDVTDTERTFRLEKSVNALTRDISNYLVKLSNANVDHDDRRRIDVLFNTINDIERVGDHAENIAELAVYKIDHNINFSEEAVRELDEMISTVFESYELSLKALQQADRSLAMDTLELEGEVDEMEKALRKQHIQRLNEGRCDTNSGIIFLDMLSNLERVSDHAANIAATVLDEIED